MLQVLLVDDDVNMLELLKVQIPWERCGYTVMDTAHNGEAALKLIERRMPDLIITDVKMPVMDGLSFCKSVRQMRDDVPIILLSAYEDMETARLAIKYNVIEYMLKPLGHQKIQLICQLLQELAHNHEQQLFYVSICNLPSFQCEITTHLVKMDVDWFQTFFDRFVSCFSIRFQIIQTACVNMINLLYANYTDGSRLIREQRERLYQCNTKLEMVSLVSQLYDQVLHPVESEIFSGNYQRGIFQQIYDYVSEHYMLPECGASMLADRFHFSSDHISRLFRRYTGETLSAYINKRRMEYALELLENPKLSVNDVAIQSGFRNQNYFARFFRKNMQVSPTEYRVRRQIEARGVRDEK